MSKKLNVSGTIYDYPSQGENPDWGQQAAEWAEAITDQVNSLITEDDVPRTAFTIQNNQTSQPITGLAFFTGRVRTAFVEYAITRQVITEEVVTDELNESGKLTLIYRDMTNDWAIEQETVGGYAGVTFDVQPTGQVLYTSSDFTGQNYSQMVFSARAFVRP